MLQLTIIVLMRHYISNGIVEAHGGLRITEMAKVQHFNLVSQFNYCNTVMFVCTEIIYVTYYYNHFSYSLFNSKRYLDTDLVRKH